MHSSFVKLLCGNVTALFNGIFSSMPLPLGVWEMQIANKYKVSITFVLKLHLGSKLGLSLGLFYPNNGMHSGCSNKHHILSILRISPIIFTQLFTVFVCACLLTFGVCVRARVFVSLCVLQIQPRNSLQSLRVVYMLLFPSLRASHQSELSTPPSLALISCNLLFGTAGSVIVLGKIKRRLRV